MSAERERILAAIRRGLSRSTADRLREGDFEKPRPRLIPERARLGPEPMLELFVAMAEEAAASVSELDKPADLPAEVTRLARAAGLDGTVAVAPALRALAFDWAGLEVRFDRALGDEQVSVTPAFAGIAETGTLMMVSGPATPTTLNFLPALHVVVLRKSRIVGPYEHAWDLLRRELSDMPRTVNFITGPSRSGDIGQTLYMGAHGPLSVHVLLSDDEI